MIRFLHRASRILLYLAMIAVAYVVLSTMGCAHSRELMQDDWPDYDESRDNLRLEASYLDSAYVTVRDSILDANFTKAHSRSGR